jgi:hypothetical protein
MFPIATSTLSFGEIAEYWSREIRPTAKWEELLGALESAYWLGELRGISGPTRLQRLKNMFTSLRHRDDLGIVFIAGDCAVPLPVELPDLKVDLRHQIRVPSSNTESWDETACTNAFHTLAKTSSKESYPELTAGFTLIELSYEEFNTWREKRGYHETNFWKPRDQLERKTWQKKPGCELSPAQSEVLKAINVLWPDGTLDHKAKARDDRILKQLKIAEQAPVSSRTIQRTLKKILFC